MTQPVRQEVMRVQQDDRPLTDRERAQVERLFSDPFSFPQAFKQWLIDYLQTADLILPRTSVQGLVNALAAVRPTGLEVKYDIPGTGGSLEISVDDGSLHLKTEGTGDLILELGSGTNLMLVGVPTADPGVSGAVWNNAGVLNVSP